MPWSFRARIEVQAQLAGQIQVRTLSGRNDDPVDGTKLADAARGFALDDHLIADGIGRG